MASVIGACPLVPYSSVGLAPGPVSSSGRFLSSRWCASRCRLRSPCLSCSRAKEALSSDVCAARKVSRVTGGARSSPPVRAEAATAATAAADPGPGVATPCTAGVAPAAAASGVMAGVRSSVVPGVAPQAPVPGVWPSPAWCTPVAMAGVLRPARLRAMLTCAARMSAGSPLLTACAHSSWLCSLGMSGKKSRSMMASSCAVNSSSASTALGGPSVPGSTLTWRGWRAGGGGISWRSVLAAMMLLVMAVGMGWRGG
mmetsp:Transcript_33322/g.84442  ORF Transcript_33322/g.84442 Transcript_33322/m.84442 type:complete len:256 (+) Transcript_33322:250-1017(+)